METATNSPIIIEIKCNRLWLYLIDKLELIAIEIALESWYTIRLCILMFISSAVHFLYLSYSLFSSVAVVIIVVVVVVVVMVAENGHRSTVLYGRWFPYFPYFMLDVKSFD